MFPSNLCIAALESNESLRTYHPSQYLLKRTPQYISLMLPSHFDCSNTDENHGRPAPHTKQDQGRQFFSDPAVTLWMHNWIILLQLIRRFLSLPLEANSSIIFHLLFWSSPLMHCHETAAWRLTVEFPSGRTAFSTVLFIQKKSFSNIPNAISFWEFPDL